MIAAPPARRDNAQDHVVDPASDLKRKKENKVRSAWISFTGRILAQCVGAAATVAFGLMFLQRHPPAATPPVPAATVTPIAAISTPPVRERQGDHVWLAVLPFEDYSSDLRDGHFVDAMTETLITSLSQVKGVRIVSRTSSMHHKGTKQPLPEVARALGVDWIVEGSIYRVQERVRVSSQLIDAATDEHIWAQSYDRPFVDPLALQARLASAISTAVDSVLQDRQPRVQPPGVSPVEGAFEPWPQPIRATTELHRSSMSDRWRTGGAH
jgi:TolB-like protein